MRWSLTQLLQMQVCAAPGRLVSHVHTAMTRLQVLHPFAGELGMLMLYWH